jgi:4-amino-4-deoxy-L-arabinose transferase-like glycosyltransferase
MSWPVRGGTVATAERALGDEAVRRGVAWAPALALSALAAAVRLLVATRREGIDVDGINYLANARAVLDGTALDALHPPLYSLALVPLLALGGDPEWLARVLSAMLGALWVWPTVWLARETADETAAWTAGLLVAVMPAGIDAGTRVLPDTLAGLCLASALGALAWMLRSGSFTAAATAGALGALTTLARPEGMGYLPLACAVVLLGRLVSPWCWPWRRVAGATAVLLLVWLAVLAPYAALVRAQTGRWDWSGKTDVTLRWAESVGAERPHAVVERVITGAAPPDGPRGMLAYVAAQPAAVARRVLVNLHLLDRYGVPGLLQSGGLVLVALGLAHLNLSRSGRPEWLLPLALVPAAGFLLFRVEPRMFVTLVPVLGVIAALGVGRLGRSGGRAAVTSGVVLALVLLSFVPWIVRPWFREDPAAVEKAAGLWLRAAAGPGALFVGRSPVVSYYAGAHSVPFAERPLDAVLDDARRQGARFVVADSVRLPASRPDLLGLVAGDRVRPELELARILEDRGGNRVTVYRLR